MATSLQPSPMSALGNPLSARSHEPSAVSSTSGVIAALGRKGTSNASSSGALTARSTSATALRRKNSGEQAKNAVTKEELEREQRRKEHQGRFQKLQAQRERDDAVIKEKAGRSSQIREQKFQEMMDDVRSNDGIRVEVAHIIQQYEMEQDKKRHQMWSEFDRDVSQRIELQLQKFMTRKDPTPAQKLMQREELLASDDPTKRCLREQKAEAHFRRIADTVIQSGPLSGRASLKKQQYLREHVEDALKSRASTRPVLPVDQWGQQELFSGPYGHFAQRCERADNGEPFHPSKRMGADRHMPDEVDGVQAAGKKRVKSRIETQYNHPGMLAGDHAKEGEAVRHKRQDGAGSGAPLQDHYFYDRGNDVVESEFPVGKRCFPHLRET